MNDLMVVCRSDIIGSDTRVKEVLFLYLLRIDCLPAGNMSKSYRWFLLPNEDYALDMKAKLLRMYQSNFCCRFSNFIGLVQS